MYRNGNSMRTRTNIVFHVYIMQEIEKVFSLIFHTLYILISAVCLLYTVDMRFFDVVVVILLRISNSSPILDNFNYYHIFATPM